MPDIEYIRSEIERIRMQVYRQRGEIRQLQRAGISTTSAEALLDRMLNNIDGLCSERDRLKKEQPRPDSLLDDEHTIVDLTDDEARAVKILETLRDTVDAIPPPS